MIVRYRYIFQCGQNEHSVELYNEWTREQGLFGLHNEFRSTRITDVRKDIKNHITKEQKEALKAVSSEKPQFIVIGEDGKTLES